jgi:FtsZ-interacting cell division protein ZipA
MPVSELQLGLIGAGVVVVGAVWTYNLWQERKHKKLAEKVFKGAQQDVLLQGQEDKDEAVRVAPAAAPATPARNGERIEPVVEPVAVRVEPVIESAPSAPPAEWADDIADCAVRIEFPNGVSAPALWSVQAAWAEGLLKPLSWVGYEAAGRKWKRLGPHDAGSYGLVVAALQLADRQGAASAQDIAAFLDGVQRLAQQFGGDATLPDAEEVLAHAQALDGFCASVDVQLAVNVVETSGGSFVGTKLRGLAEASGMALEEDGRYHARADDGTELFAFGNLGAELFTAESIKSMALLGISFVLDVPRVAEGPAVFERMVTAAKQMALALGGTLVDGQRHMLTDPMIDGIRGKIAEIQRQMAANQIPAGSARALRLFN